MKAQIELSSISMSKNDAKLSKLDKYDVEANIDEVDNSEDQSVFKYAFTALSNPKNVRLSIEGTARIFANTEEMNDILSKDKNDIPKILTMIYHELFPTFFLLSKSLNVSCPPHTIGAVGNGLVDKELQAESTDELQAESTDELQAESTDELQAESTDEQTEKPDLAQPTM